MAQDEKSPLVNQADYFATDASVGWLYPDNFQSLVEAGHHPTAIFSRLLQHLLLILEYEEPERADGQQCQGRYPFFPQALQFLVLGDNVRPFAT
jgi:hypothetical protein